MTPNKLPPLPVTDEMILLAVDGFNEAAGDGELLLTSLRDKERMRFALQDALRQSQSLPAGEVADDDDLPVPAYCVNGVNVWIAEQVHAARAQAFHDGQVDAIRTKIRSDRAKELSDDLQALQADAREKGEAVRAADAVFAFSAMLTSLPKIVPFGAAAWATPGVELAVAFIKTNGLGECSPDFPGGIKFPDFEGELLSVVERAALATQPAQASEKERGEATGDTTTFKDAWARLSPIDRSVISIYFQETHPQPVTPAGGEVEPVAWIAPDRLQSLIGGWSATIYGNVAKNYSRPEVVAATVALYTHPPVADAALVRGAERYRWLRDHAFSVGLNTENLRAEYSIGRQSALDETIDLAMQDDALNQRGGGCEHAE